MTTATAACTHHWKIRPPEGPTSRGKCKRCGAVKIFANVSDFQETGNWATMTPTVKEEGKWQSTARSL